MATLVVRNLDESIVALLKRRAVEHGVSAEEEHRRLLREALAPKSRGKKSFIEHLMEMPGGGEDWVFDRHDPRNQKPARNPVDF